MRVPWHRCRDDILSAIRTCPASSNTMTPPPPSPLRLHIDIVLCLSRNRLTYGSCIIRHRHIGYIYTRYKRFAKSQDALPDGLRAKLPKRAPLRDAGIEPALVLPCDWRTFQLLRPVRVPASSSRISDARQRQDMFVALSVLGAREDINLG
ncbi:hypothetical protein PYCCODRAFT_429605 [Trametes coccinea BRFM310]|uniref:Uncharacterized protein n=1 Tax=Trametes coccinea (strain BRFM310) TaxID=1353009 RepID=A0A1Y2IQ24_TRAC3|nr:hypothetical protein PYCCODRAFT_429605 [Trametes coccinea BRFM310]